MRTLILVSAGLLALVQCAPVQHPTCEEQGFQPGEDGYAVCQDAGGNPLATGPGSPFANNDREFDSE